MAGWLGAFVALESVKHVAPSCRLRPIAWVFICVFGVGWTFELLGAAINHEWLPETGQMAVQTLTAMMVAYVKSAETLSRASGKDGMVHLARRNESMRAPPSGRNTGGPTSEDEELGSDFTEDEPAEKDPFSKAMEDIRQLAIENALYEPERGTRNSRPPRKMPLPSVIELRFKDAEPARDFALWASRDFSICSTEASRVFWRRFHLSHATISRLSMAA